MAWFKLVFKLSVQRVSRKLERVFKLQVQLKIWIFHFRHFPDVHVVATTVTLVTPTRSIAPDLYSCKHFNCIQRNDKVMQLLPLEVLLLIIELSSGFPSTGSLAALARRTHSTYQTEAESALRQPFHLRLLWLLRQFLEMLGNLGHNFRESCFSPFPDHWTCPRYWH